MSRKRCARFHWLAANKEKRVRDFCPVSTWHVSIKSQIENEAEFWLMLQLLGNSKPKRMLFIDFSLAHPQTGPAGTQNTSLCNWLLDLLMGRPQAIRTGSNTSSTITVNTGPPKGSVLRPLLFTLLTHNSTPTSSSNLFVKFAATRLWWVSSTSPASSANRQQLQAEFLGVNISQDLSRNIKPTRAGLLSV